AIESRGIPTATLMLVREIAEKIRAPRALAVPFPHGYPLGQPHDRALQKSVMLAALQLMEREDEPPLLVDYA
ncbi:MAG: selenoprotein B, partial [Thermoanaerobaculia bacterium]